MDSRAPSLWKLLILLQLMMETLAMSYSRKNIPIPSRSEYETNFVEKAESVLGRMKWKAFHALNPDKQSGIESYGFNTTRAPPAVPELKEFEQDLLGLLKKIKFYIVPKPLHTINFLIVCLSHSFYKCCSCV